MAYYYTLEQGDYRADIVMSFLRNGLQNIYLSDNLGRKEEYSYQQQMPQCGWIQVGVLPLVKGKVKLILHDKGAFPEQLVFAGCGEVGEEVMNVVIIEKAKTLI